MHVLVVTPAEPVVDLATVKAHLNIFEDVTDQDDYITGLIAAATDWIDGPGGWLGRCIGEQTLELRFDGFPCEFYRPGYPCRPCDHPHGLRLPFPPIVDLVSIKYLDPTGADLTLDPSAYSLATDRVLPAFATAWPACRYTPDSIRLQYTAGYATVPKPIVHAILMLVGHFYLNREAVVGVDNRDSSTPLPLGVDALLTPYRVWA